MIELTMIVSNRGQSMFTDTDEPGEGPAAPVTSRVSVNPASIRAFYPRKGGEPGTRITFTDGGGFAVIEDYEAVKAKISPTPRGRITG